MIGANHLSALYIKLSSRILPGAITSLRFSTTKFFLFGHGIVGVQFVSTIAHIARTIQEFEVHGVCIDRIIVGGNDALL